MNFPIQLAQLGHIVDKEGKAHPEFQQNMAQMAQYMQTNLSQEGYVLPQLTSTQVSQLDPSKNIGAMFYNSSTNTFMVNINGTFKTVTVS